MSLPVQFYWGIIPVDISGNEILLSASLSGGDDEDLVKGGSTSATARALWFRNLLQPLGLVTSFHPVYPPVLVTVPLHWRMYQDCDSTSYCCYPTRKTSYHTRSAWQPQRGPLWQPTGTAAVQHPLFPVFSKEKQKTCDFSLQSPQKKDKSCGLV